MYYIGAYAINGKRVTAPDEEAWQNIVLGDSNSGGENRSPYKILEWRKRVAGRCNLDWFDYDNTQLSSLVTRAPGELSDWQEYTTDVHCKSVTFRQTRSIGNEVVATFLVYVG